MTTPRVGIAGFEYEPDELKAAGCGAYCVSQAVPDLGWKRALGVHRRTAQPDRSPKRVNAPSMLTVSAASEHL